MCLCLCRGTVWLNFCLYIAKLFVSMSSFPFDLIQFAGLCFRHLLFRHLFALFSFQHCSIRKGEAVMMTIFFISHTMESFSTHEMRIQKNLENMMIKFVFLSKLTKNLFNSIHYRECCCCLSPALILATHFRYSMIL